MLGYSRKLRRLWLYEQDIRMISYRGYKVASGDHKLMSSSLFITSRRERESFQKGLISKHLGVSGIDFISSLWSLEVIGSRFNILNSSESSWDNCSSTWVSFWNGIWCYWSCNHDVYGFIYIWLCNRYDYSLNLGIILEDHFDDWICNFMNFWNNIYRLFWWKIVMVIFFPSMIEITNIWE